MEDAVNLMASKWTHEFLGRCQGCLNNAFLDDECGAIVCGQRVPDEECLVKKVRSARWSDEHGGAPAHAV